MSTQRTKKHSTENTPKTINKQDEPIKVCTPDLLDEPILRLKRLQGAVTLLTHLGSRELECTDPDAILSFCELVEDYLSPTLEELDALQLAFNSQVMRYS